MKNNRGLYLQFLLSSVCLFLLWSCNAKQAAETSAEKIEKPVIEKPVVKTTEEPDSVDEFAEEESSGGEESDNSSLADQLLEFQFSTFAPSEKESGKALTEVEKRRLLATAKILQAARTTVPDPGPYKLVELEGVPKSGRPGETKVSSEEFSLSRLSAPVPRLSMSGPPTMPRATDWVC